MDQILAGVVDLLPPAMQFPEIACARIIFDGQEFQTHDFRVTPWQQSFAIVVRGEQAGQVEVNYLEERQDGDEGLFLKEEQLLLAVVAERLGRIIERKQAQERLHEEIAERKETERELQVQSNLFESLLEATPDFIEVFDPDTLAYIKVNKALIEVTGYSEEEFGKLSPADIAIFSEADAKRVEATIDRVLREGEGIVTANVNTKDGRQIPMEFLGSLATDAEGNPLYVVSVGRDMTERIRAEEALLASEEMYRDLVEKISDVIYTVDAGGVITYVNPAGESLLGAPLEEIAGKPFADFFHSEDMERIQNNFQNLLSGTSPGSVEYRVLTTTGETRWTRVSSQPIMDEGQVIGVQGVLTDITERRRVEAQLEEAAAAAERQRLARELHDSVTQGLYSASLIAETLPLVWEEDPEEARRGLEQLERLTGGALAEMRTLLLELRPSVLEHQELPALLRQLADATLARTRTVITTTVVGDCTIPTSVKVALYRIAQEALNNVVKHARARHARVNLDADGERVTLRISDDGCGFDPVAASQGLGLGIVRDRAGHIDARLHINSQPDQGTEVLVVWEGSVME
jgi:PAS domain S-box-containing protein